MKKVLALIAATAMCLATLTGLRRQRCSIFCKRKWFCGDLR